MREQHAVTTDLPQVIGCCMVSGAFVSVGVHANRALVALDEEGRAALVAELAALWALGERGMATRADAGCLEAAAVRR